MYRSCLVCRWLVLKDTYLMYVNPDTGTLRDVLLMDPHFKYSYGHEKTGIRHGLVVSNLNR